MNLADIRKKAQQAQKGVRDEASRCRPEGAPLTPPQRELPKAAASALSDLPDPTPACEVKAKKFEPVEAVSLGTPEPPKPPIPTPPAVSAAKVGPAAAPPPSSSPELEAVCAPLEVPVTTFPAIVGAPTPPPPPDPEVFDPLAVILRGRELAESLDFDAEVVTQDAASLELLCFRVATEEYAINIMDIKEIVRPRDVTEVPRVPDFVRGILSLRGIIIPVFDMRVRLGLPVKGGERERVIVVKRGGGFCGVHVDEVVQVVRIPAQGIEPPPVILEGIDREFVEGIGRVSDRMLILLDMEKVLDVTLG